MRLRQDIIAHELTLTQASGNTHSHTPETAAALEGQCRTPHGRRRARLAARKKTTTITAAAAAACGGSPHALGRRRTLIGQPSLSVLSSGTHSAAVMAEGLTLDRPISNPET